MEFKSRIKKTPEVVELKVTFIMSREEYEGALRICDDPNLKTALVSSDLDQVSCYLRILNFWRGIWDEKENWSDFILRSIRSRERLEKKLNKPKRRRK